MDGFERIFTSRQRLRNADEIANTRHCLIATENHSTVVVLEVRDPFIIYDTEAGILKYQIGYAPTRCINAEPEIVSGDNLQDQNSL